jgi:hypothetical protein
MEGPYKTEGITMTDAELLAHEKIGPVVAARYLQNGTNPHDLRLDAQEGKCPFMIAKRGKGRYSYRVNVGLLIAYKHGELGLYGTGDYDDYD